MKRKRIIFLIATLQILFALESFAQRNTTGYWQQRANYNIDLELNVKNHEFSGHETIQYINYSPDTLSILYFHLFFNAFKPGSKMDIHSLSIKDPDSRVMDRISKLEKWEEGDLSIQLMSQKVFDYATNTYKDFPIKYNAMETLLKADLKQPLLPNDTTSIYLEFKGKVPIQIRRSGRNNKEGIDYSMTQWYPKIAEYDYSGWNTNDYVGREFHGVWGDYDVNIYIDNSYILAGTGELVNGDEIGYGYQTKINQKYNRKPEEKNKWHFTARNVIDFAFAADPDYIHSSTQIQGGPKLHFFYQKGKYERHWDALPQKVITAMLYMNRTVGTYPYPQYSFIQGGDGGMEYPMCTLITGNRNEDSLTSVAIHELVHSWFQMMLATNETLFAWMDEGFTTYFSAQVIRVLQGNNGINHQVGYKGYFSLVNSGEEEPASTPADHFKLNFAYSHASYSKGAVFLSMLRNIVGQENFSKGMKRYFYDWAFKHPTPNDFIRSMEKVSGMQLDWFLHYAIYSTKTIDYGIKNINRLGEGETEIVIERIGDFPIPIHVQIVAVSEEENLEFYIPLDLTLKSKPVDRNTKILKPWSFVSKEYKFIINIPISQINDVNIDPNNYITDINRKNNSKKTAKK